MVKFNSRNKMLTAALTASLVVAVGVPSQTSAANESGFKDVSKNYEEAINFLVENGITYGKSANLFGTDDSINRADAAIFIARALGIHHDELAYENFPFKDVPARAQWAVHALAEQNIISGFSSTHFGADEPLTRNQMAKILANAGKLEVKTTDKKTQFKDVNGNFAPYVEALVKSGVTKGKTKDTYGAMDKVTRGEMALFINRAQTHFGFMELLVMHINDTHGYLDKYPYIATAVNDLRSKNDNNLLLHAGDIFSGDLYSNAFKGKADLAMMNHLKFDAMTFGNHEFDFGNDKGGHTPLANFVKGAEFPLLGANVDFSGDPLFDGMQTKKVMKSYKDGHIYNGVVLNVGGQEVGVFGLTTEETPTISAVGEVKFTNYIAEAKKSVKAFEDMGINKIIAVTHIGYNDSLKFDNDLELAKQVEGIDIIVGGHTHSALNEPHIVNHYDGPTAIVQAQDYGKALGKLNVSFNSRGYLTEIKGELINTDPEGRPPTTLKTDEKTFSILAPFAAEVLKLKTESIGKESLVLLDGRRAADSDNETSVRFNETSLGNLMTDAMLWKAKTIEPEAAIALQNGGGIRASIPAGDITVGGVLKAMPFGNPLAIAELSGEEIRSTIEHAISADLREGGGLKENGAFLHVSGMKFTYDSTLKAGSRIKTIQVKNGEDYTDLEDSKMYIVATNNFTATGGDGFEDFEAAYADGRVSEPGFADYENFIDHVKTLEKVEPKVEGRIIDVSLN